VELRPRWPLTSAKHSSSMRPVLSMKSAAKQALSLTDMTRQELAALAARRQQQQQGELQQRGELQQQGEQQQHQQQAASGAAV
jgi:hypothetical protein